MLKRADKMFKKLGYTKIYETRDFVQYEKHIEQYGYTHCIDLGHKTAIPSIVQSYDKADEHMSGMNKFEMLAAIRKMKEKGWK